MSSEYDDYPMGDQDSHKKHIRHLNALKRGKILREKNKTAKSQALRKDMMSSVKEKGSNMGSKFNLNY